MELEGSLNRFQALLVGLQEHVEDRSLCTCTQRKNTDVHKYTLAETHTGRNTPVRPHTCCSSSSAAPCVNGWESNYYCHTGTTFSTRVSQDMCECVSVCRRVCLCVCLGVVGVSYCQQGAHTHCSLADFLSSSPLLAHCSTCSHRNTLGFPESPR